MNKKMSKRQRDIKSKLMGAVCMLLVSSIMMVSTTYAWFTLSTAPEVTGITTAVGANGNLEMALLPTSGETSDITSEAGDSIKTDAARNITWGNLVDLSDNAYGLSQITLYPAALNTEADGALGDSPLKFPTYGADGRVSDLVANTFTGVYNSNSSSFSPDTSFGVRAVGSASGMTDRQLSYRNARSTAGSAKSQAAKLASESLDSNGDALASIAVKKGTETDPKFTQTDVNTLNAIVTDLVEEDGIFDQIENAYMQYILAYAASAANTTGDAVWMYVKGLVEAENATLASVVAGITNPPADGYAVTLPSQVQNGINAFNDTVAQVDQEDDADTDANESGAKQLIAALSGKADTDGNYSWSQISPILTKLANPDAMEINGIPAGEIKAEGNMDRLVNSVLGGAGVNVVIASGGGVYADIAEQTENFTADVDIQKITFGGSSFGPVSAKMKTEAAFSYLGLIGTAVESAGAPAGGATGTVPITDMYGYIIDMAFRTNAASSNLVLQTEAVDRIYTSNNASGGAEVTVNGVTETTMGNGANMTFGSINPSFTNEDVVELMECVRVVFFDPDTKAIIKYAKLDTDNAETTTDGKMKADLVLYDLSTGTTNTVYFTATDTDEDNGTTYTVYYTDDTKTTPSARSYTDDTTSTTKWETYDATSTNWTAVDTQPNLPSEEVTTEDTLVRASDNKIMGLTQNTATKLSVLVYLDGESMSNEDVASTGSQSVVGEMNLQFSSDGNLTPMNYTPLMNQTGSSSTTTEYTVTASDTSNSVKFTGAEKTDASADYTFTLTDASDAVITSGYTVKYKVGADGTEQTLTPAADGTYTISKSAITDNVTITISAN